MKLVVEGNKKEAEMVDYDAIRRGDCPALGEGLGHVWVASDDTSDCAACGVSIPKAQPARSWLVSVKATIQGLFQRRPRV